MTRYTRRPPRYHRPESGFLKGLGRGMGFGCGMMVVYLVLFVAGVFGFFALLASI